METTTTAAKTQLFSLEYTVTKVYAPMPEVPPRNSRQAPRPQIKIQDTYFRLISKLKGLHFCEIAKSSIF